MQIKKLDKLSKRLTENQAGQEGQDNALGGASKDYKPKHGDKMPTSKSEAGSYMLNAVRSAGGVTSQEIPALIQFFDDLLDQFINQNISAYNISINMLVSFSIYAFLASLLSSESNADESASTAASGTC